MTESVTVFSPACLRLVSATAGEVTNRERLREHAEVTTAIPRFTWNVLERDYSANPNLVVFFSRAPSG
jgi:hypothetical protein